MIITRNGEDFSEINPLITGQAPDFSLKDQHGNAVTLSKLPSPIIMSVFPNINTSVCSVQTRRFNQEAAAHKEITFLSISNNTPEEQANWCAAEGVDMTIVSDAKNEFGQLYGLVMAEANLLARSVFVIKDGQIIYAEILPEMTDEPNYEKALQVADAAI
ncbi:thiol peroxidase [Lactococcus chungangensis]|jgi:Peroxiredoxin|uniref:Thiol peroxidase n=2 Tax=Pseudolactococcus chungangensis TaxID=451457 RepID=A0A1K2H783_9LACT|nr:peroxiredoxin [Lactococcus chungangensis]NCB81969.1 peroxiredoxin [Bacilli bacterium]NLH35566.1 peroxiredoxin [Lactococcus chungangensis]PCS02901.1 thiol peroxidase [Lactococcus chungangensis CAU 28 = DSM 22330]SFZ71948.1 thiol peroxidase (atypical 2-Cys peroxiredoxin) [Lactococcus chungangensis CAU 28 = DSM 22330]